MPVGPAGFGAVGDTGYKEGELTATKLSVFHHVPRAGGGGRWTEKERRGEKTTRNVFLLRW